MNKNRNLSHATKSYTRILFIALIFVISIILFNSSHAFAKVYQPGETLNPDCAPLDPGCGVSPPISTTGLGDGMALENGALVIKLDGDSLIKNSSGLKVKDDALNFTQLSDSLSLDAATTLTVTDINKLIFNRATSGLFQEFTDGTDIFGMYNVAGNPEGSITANTGSLAIDTSNGSLYIKGDDGDNTGWTAFGSAAGNSLDLSYGSGGSITTTDAKDIDIMLANTATDSNFDIDIATGGTNTVSISRLDGAGTADPTQLLLLENLDLDRAQPTGLLFSSATGGLTTAIDATNTDITNALAISSNFLLFDAMRLAELSSGVFTIEDTSGNDLLTLTDNADAGDLALTGSLFIDQDTNSLALNIDSEATTANIATIDGTVLTTGTGLDLANYNALTSGKIARFYSNSANISNRNLVEIVNDNTAAIGAVGLKIQQDADRYGILVDGDGGVNTSEILRVEGTALTTGKLAAFYSNSASTSSRNLVQITNDNTLATAAKALSIQQDSTANGLYIDQNGNGIALNIENAGTGIPISITNSASGQWLSFADGTDTFGLYNRAGTPEANIAADIGSLALDTTNGDLYIKNTDTANTGWQQFSTAAGVFITTGGVTSNSPGALATDDFVFGSIQLDDDGDVAHDNRMLFDKSKGAFRVGRVELTAWDDANRGLYSFAQGDGSKASGDRSVALGFTTQATGSGAFSSGRSTIASGGNSTAMGVSANAIGDNSVAIGNLITAQAYNSAVFGRYNEISGTTNSWVDTEPLFVLGNGASAGSRANALTVLKNGNVGIGDASPASLLTVGSGDLFQVNSSGDITTADTEALSITTGTTGALTIDSGTTGAINIGTGNNAKTIAIGTGTAGNTINLATDDTTADTVNFGSNKDIVIIKGATINIAQPVSASTVNIGNTTGATALVLKTGTGNFSLDGVAASTYTIGAATTAGTITIGGTAQTGAITFGNSTGINTTGFGVGNGANTANISTGTGGNTINLGTGAGANTLTLGNTNTTTKLVFNTGSGGIGINNTSPDASALLDMSSTSRGVLIPRMTTTQRDAITTPATGLQIYNTTTNALNYYNGTAWSAGSVPFSGFVAADKTNTIDNLNFAQVWDWSTASTQTGLAMNFNGLTSGKGLELASSATGFNGALSSISLTGSNALNTGNLLSIIDSGALNTTTPFKVTAAGAAGQTTALIENTGAGTSFRVNDAASDTSPFIIDAAGNVGVGTATPTNALTFAASSTIDSLGALTMTSAVATGMTINSGTTGALTLDSGTTGAINIGTGANAKTVTIGNITGATALVLNSGTAGITTSSTATTGNGLALTTNSLTTGTGMAITSSYASGNSTNGLLYVANTGAVTNGIIARIASNSTAGSGLTVLASGNVGIGTTTPAQKLHIVGAAGSPATTGTTQNGIYRITNTSNNASLDIGTLTASPYTTWIQSVDSTNLANNLPLSLNPNGGSLIIDGTKLITDKVQGSVNNINIGPGTLENTTTLGLRNVAIGFQAMQDNTDGDENTAVGYWALRKNTTGIDNTAFGRGALHNSVTGNNNVAIGKSAGFSFTGTQSTFLGSLAGSNANSGSGNILIGYNAQPTDSTISNQLNIGGAIYGDLSAGNVGIGATDPSTTLDLNGAFTQRGMAAPALSPSGQGRIYFDSTSNTYKVSEHGGAYSNLVGAAILSALTAATATNSIDSLNFAQTWDWSTATTQTPLTINADALTTGSGLAITSSYASGNSTNGLLYVANTGAVTNGTIARIQSNSTAGSGLTVLASGNIGIGTNAPTSTLTFAAGSTINSLGALYITSATATAMSVKSGTTGTLTLDSGTTGAVNIGTGASSKTVTIGNGIGNSSVRIQNGTGNLNIGGPGTGALYFDSAGSIINIGANYGATQTITIGASNDKVYTGGKLGVKTTDTSVGELTVKQTTTANGGPYALALMDSTSSSYWGFNMDTVDNLIFAYNGTWKNYMNTAGDWYKTSDVDKKKDIVDSNYGLDQILQMRPVSFHYNEEGSSDVLHYGFIAQDVESIMPEFVSTAQDGTKAMTYASLIAPAIKAIQEQQTIIDLIESDVDALKNGMITIDTLDKLTIKGAFVVEGNATFAGKVRFEDQVTFNSDTAGKATLLTGDDEVTITFVSELDSVPIVNVTPLGIVDTKYGVKEVTTKGFTIVIDQVQSLNTMFNWSAILTKD